MAATDFDLHEWTTKLGAESFSRYVPIIDEITTSEDEHIGYIIEGGYLGTTWLCNPATGYSEKTLQALDSLFKRTYPEGTFIQFSLVASDDLNQPLEDYLAIRGGRNRHPSKLNMDLMGEYMVDFYKALSETSIPSRDMDGVPLRMFEVWVSLKVPIKKAMPTDDEVEEYQDSLEQFESSLDQIFGRSFRMRPEVLVNRMQMLHNPSTNAIWRKGPAGKNSQGSYRPTQPVRNQYLENGTEVKFQKNHIEIINADGASRFIRSVSVKEYPDTVYQGALHMLTSDWLHGNDGAIPGNFMMTLTIEMSPKAVGKMYSKRRVAAKQIGEGPWARWISALKYNLQDFEYYEHYIEKEKAQHCRFHLNFQIWAKSEKEAKNHAKKLISRMEGMSWQAGVDSMITQFTWLNSLPLCSSKTVSDFIERFDFVPSNLLKFFVPMVASWRGNAIQKPVLTYFARDGQLLTFNPMVSDSNYNMFITATSGSGKSFTANYLIEALLSTGEHRPINPYKRQGAKPDGGRVFVIDSGKSYIKLTDMLGGQFVEVVPDHTFQYNLDPFKTIEERFIYEEDDDKAPSHRGGLGPQGEMLLSILKLMAFPMGECTSYQLSQMSDILINLWYEKGPESSIDLFAERCSEHPKPEIKIIAEQLGPWRFSKGGLDSWMFNPNKPPIQFEKDFVVLELDGLNGSDKIKAVCIMLCIQRIQQEMFRHDQKDIVKAFILDEAWEFLKENKAVDAQIAQVLQALAKFLESGWRRFRKYGSIGICISQSLKDANESPAGIAMATNSAHLLYLMQNSEELARLNKEGKFLEQDYDLLSSIKTVRPYFSEVMIQTGGAKTIGRLYVPRAKALSYSTAPDEVRKIEEEQARCGGEMWTACQIIAQKEGNDIVANWRKEKCEEDVDDAA